MRKVLIGAATIVLSTLILHFGTANAATLNLFGFEFNAKDTPRISTNQTSAALLTASSDTNQGDVTDSCLQYADHEYEVCVAYIFNASLADLLPYYKYAHSPNTSVRDFIHYRLGSRYIGQANTLLQNRVANWPEGTMSVAIPRIKITSVNASLATNTATLTTIESWKVTNSSRQVIYQENNAHHTSTMQRVPSYLLHKWVVTNIQ